MLHKHNICCLFNNRGEGTYTDVHLRVAVYTVNACCDFLDMVPMFNDEISLISRWLGQYGSQMCSTGFSMEKSIGVGINIQRDAHVTNVNMKHNRRYTIRFFYKKITYLNCCAIPIPNLYITHDRIQVIFLYGRFWKISKGPTLTTTAYISNVCRLYR